MAKNYTIALDIDGTLIDKKGKLDKRVFGIFKNSDIKNVRFILVTGGTVTNARNALKEINTALELEGHRKISAWMCVNCGAEIYSPQGRLMDSVVLDNSQILTITNAVRSKDKNSIIAYSTRCGKHYVEDGKAHLNFDLPRVIKNKVLMRMFMRKESVNAKGNAGVYFDTTKKIASEQQLERFKKWGGGIFAVYVIPTCSTKEMKDGVFDVVRAAAGKLPVYKGEIITVSASTKRKAIEKVIEYEKDNPCFADNITQVVYIGDNANDVEMLRTARLSIARGEQAKQEAKEAAKLCLNDLDKFSKDLYEDCAYDGVIYGTESQVKQ